jgi:hypothetical protein
MLSAIKTSMEARTVLQHVDLGQVGSVPISMPANHGHA